MSPIIRLRTEWFPALAGLRPNSWLPIDLTPDCYLIKVTDEGKSPVSAWQGRGLVWILGIFVEKALECLREFQQDWTRKEDRRHKSEVVQRQLFDDHMRGEWLG